MRRALRPLALTLAFCALLETTAGADQLEHFGFGGRQAALAGAGVAIASDAAAVVHNPAGLVLGGRRQISIGYRYVGFDLRLSSTRPAKDERAEDAVDNFGGTEVGVVFPFGTPDATARFSCPTCGTRVAVTTRRCPLETCRTEFDPVDTPSQPFAVGVYLFSPTSGGIRISSRSSEVPQFVAYENGTARLESVPALAWRIRPGLAVGAGVQTLADSSIRTLNEVDANFRTDVTLESKLRLESAPVVGVQWHPTDALRLGAVYRGEMSLEIDGMAVTDIAGIVFFPTRIQSIALFSPRQATVGVAWAGERLTTAFDLAWLDWSTFPGVGTQTATASGSSIPGQPSPVAPPGFRDIWIPRLGIEWTARPDLALRGGYAFRPSPAPEQKGQQNLIDTSKHILAGGIGTEWGDGHIAADLYAQLHLLVPEKVRKQAPPTPRGTGDFKAGGRIWSVGLTLSYRF